MKVLFGGDFVPIFRIKDRIQANDFSFIDEVKEITSSVDLSVLNLEAPIVGEGSDVNQILKTGPNLSSSESCIKLIKYAGFDCVCLANNHFRDFGQGAVEMTLRACHEAGLRTVGGGTTYCEAVKPCYIQVGDKTISVINICESEWSIANEKRGGSNPIDIVRVYNDIQTARNKSDYVVVIVHGGIEWYNLPTPEMKKLYRFFIDVGADAVINHHQHCYSGYEVYKKRPIFYGLGNLCFDNEQHKRTFWHEGILVQLDFSDDFSFEIIPYVQCTEKPVVYICRGDRDILTNISDLNKIIEDDKALRISYLEYIKQYGRARLDALQPYPNFLKPFYSKGLLPNLLTNNWKRLALNLIRCESHRDILIKVLEDEIEN